MKVKIWGARGSIPTSLSPEAVEEKICQAIYTLKLSADEANNIETVRAAVKQLPLLIRGTAGGATTCVEVQSGGETIIIDAGSGIRKLGLELLKGPCGRGEGKIHLLFSSSPLGSYSRVPFFPACLYPW